MEEARRRKLPSITGGVAILVLAVVLGAVSGSVVTLLLSDAGDENGGETAGAGPPADEVSQVAARALPSVVAIVNELEPRPERPSAIAGGAGVILDDRGFILTNAHIVTEPGKLSVLLYSGEIRPATLISHDAPFTDLAVLRIQPGGLRSLPLGDSESLAPGQTVMAIGSPDIDYMNSVTVGVVSALHRRKELNGVWAEDLIQTDAAINVGNSGGPLINQRGQVVGLISFRDIGRDDPLFGISFAISSRTILPIARTMVEQGKFPRPYIGIDHRNVDEEVARSANLPVDQGAVVLRVIEGSPAQRAGLRAGDVLLRLGRFELDGQLPFINALAQVGINERVPVQFLRDGRLMETTVETAQR